MANFNPKPSYLGLRGPKMGLFGPFLGQKTAGVWGRDLNLSRLCDFDHFEFSKWSKSGEGLESTPIFGQK